jgi:hypothetical protein
VKKAAPTKPARGAKAGTANATRGRGKGAAPTQNSSRGRAKGPANTNAKPVNNTNAQNVARGGARKGQTVRGAAQGRGGRQQAQGRPQQQQQYVLVQSPRGGRGRGAARVVPVLPTARRMLVASFFFLFFLFFLAC